MPDLTAAAAPGLSRHPPIHRFRLDASDDVPALVSSSASFASPRPSPAERRSARRRPGWAACRPQGPDFKPLDQERCFSLWQQARAATDLAAVRQTFVEVASLPAPLRAHPLAQLCLRCRHLPEAERARSLDYLVGAVTGIGASAPVLRLLASACMDEAATGLIARSTLPALREHVGRLHEPARSEFASLLADDRDRRPAPPVRESLGPRYLPIL